MSCLSGSSSEGQREGGIQDSNRVDAYLPLHPPLPPPRWPSRQEVTPKQTTFEKRLSFPLSALEMAARKVDGMKQPRGCGNILPNNDRSEMCFQRRRVGTWYNPPQMRQPATVSGGSMSAGTGGTRHGPHKRSTGSRETWSRGPNPHQVPWLPDTARLRVGTRDLGSELGPRGSCLSVLLLNAGYRLLALFLAAK